jgi:hypothetical protein
VKRSRRLPAEIRTCDEGRPKVEDPASDEATVKRRPDDEWSRPFKDECDEAVDDVEYLKDRHVDGECDEELGTRRRAAKNIVSAKSSRPRRGERGTHINPCGPSFPPTMSQKNLRKAIPPCRINKLLSVNLTRLGDKEASCSDVQMPAQMTSEAGDEDTWVSSVRFWHGVYQKSHSQVAETRATRRARSCQTSLPIVTDSEFQTQTRRSDAQSVERV